MNTTDAFQKREKINNDQTIGYGFHGTIPEGVSVLRRVSDSIFIGSFITKQAKINFQRNGGTLLVVNNHWKLSPALLQDKFGTDKNKWESIFLSVKDIDLFESQYKKNQQIKLIRKNIVTKALMVLVKASFLETILLEDPNIYFISKSGKPFTERELTGFDLSANKVNIAHTLWPDVNGKGLTVSIKENKMDTADIDFSGRYQYSPLASTKMETHATTMSTIVAGGGNTFFTGKGVAWAASLISSDFANLFPDNTPELQKQNVSVQNHSYGVGIENYYGADAAAYDVQAEQLSPLLHVFSAGNGGDLTSSAGNYSGIPGFANITGSFKMSKNSLSIGAIDSFAQVTKISSRGPAFDGRLKPELVAFGEDGSSGSAAIVSGIALLIQDAWKKAKGVLPPSSLTKAILINSADDIGPDGIDFQTGYGSVNAKAALQTVVQNHVIENTIQTNQTTKHILPIPSNVRKLKITLCWADPAASVNSFKALVNDLDLTLKNPSGADVWLPWVLNSSPSKDSLIQLPKRKRDSLNNIEQITIENPVFGDYSIEVKAYSVNGTQPYAIVWQIDTLSHFLFSYPVKGDYLIPKQSHTLRWETGLQGLANIEYRINTGNWQNAANDVILSKGYVQWVAPDTMGAIQFRLLAGNKEWKTDTVGLSKPLLINTGYNCIDSFLIYWQGLGVTNYRLFRLGKEYLAPFYTTSDTVILQSKQNNPYLNYAVSPVLPFQIDGVRSYTFNYTKQNNDCYISSFIADPVGVDKASLSLQLGTTFQVNKIVFEKLSSKGFVAFETITPVALKNNRIIAPAGKGLHTYRASIFLQNGLVYHTQRLGPTTGDCDCGRVWHGREVGDVTDRGPDRCNTTRCGLEHRDWACIVS